MNAKQAIRALSDDSLLASFPKELLDRLAPSFQTRKVEASTLVARQGELADRLIIPIDVSLGLFTRTASGRREVVGRLAARRALSLSTVLRAGSHDYAAETEHAGTVLELPGPVFLSALSQFPDYRRYLERITGRRSIQSLARALRDASVGIDMIRRMIAALGEVEVGEGELVLGTEAAWILVDEGTCRLELDELGARSSLGGLSAGEFYGASSALIGARKARVVAESPVRAFVLAHDALAALATDPSLRRALIKEKPEVVRRMRAALVEIGERFTDVFQPPEDNVQLPPSLGEPWSAPPSAIRALEGLRARFEEDSGASALVALLRAHGRTATVAEVRRLLERSPPSFLDLAGVAERAGLVTHAGKVSGQRALERIELPALTVIGARFVVVYEAGKKSLCVFDPLSGPRILRRTDLEGRWTGAVLSASDPKPFLAGSNKRQAESKKVNDASRSLRYFKLLGGTEGLLLSAGSLSVLALLLSLLVPKLSGLIVDRAFAHRNLELLNVIAIGLVIINASTFVLNATRELISSQLASFVDWRLSTLVHRHTLGVNPSVHGDDRVGRALTRVSELRRVRESITTDLVDLGVQVIQGVGALTAVLFLSARLGLIAVVVAPLAYLQLTWVARRLRDGSAKMFDQSSRFQDLSAEQIEAIASIKSSDAELAARNRWEAVLVDGVNRQRDVLNASMAGQIGLRVIQEVARLVGLFLAVRMVLDRELTAGQALAATQYLGVALRPIFEIATKLDRLERVAVTVKRLDQLLGEPLEAEASLRAEPELLGRVSARGLAFRYDDGPMILEDVSFEAEPGQIIAIVGRSGSGKTTLARLIAGALHPSAGEIGFDGHDGRTLSRWAIKRAVGVVMQESQLFAGSIRDNIAYQDDRPDEGRVREASRLAGVHEFVREFPAGYDTYLAEGGLGLSGGQRQRVCLARALYRDPKVLVLDEATSALDVESERIISANMREILRGRTAIVIAHRLNTVKNADLILVLDGGRVIERGSHSELMAERGHYHALFSQQLSQL
ncbi:MAG: ATP-binding cassette domain-containing protein [Deltaproteobacteria bacterium]|nr:ATP-binding cassette domain-containing protein [Deltaproteobacteria bacterium]